MKKVESEPKVNNFGSATLIPTNMFRVVQTTKTIYNLPVPLTLDLGAIFCMILYRAMAAVLTYCSPWIWGQSSA